MELLNSNGSVSSADLVERFAVSAMTIRRDLEQLEEAGLAIRSYGGAVAAQRITLEFAFEQRHRTNLAAKARIGQAAAELVLPGNNVFLDTGTTTLEVARALAKRRIPCHVMTSSLVVASELWGSDVVELSLLGGKVRKGSPDLAGSATEWMLERMLADVAFLGSEEIDAGRGSFAGDVETARIAEQMARNSRCVVVVADSSKFTGTGAVRYADTDSIDRLITDADADSSQVEAFEKADVAVQCV